MGMSIDEAIERFKSNSKYERKHGNLQGCLEFAQLVDWLSKYQQLQADYENRLKADLKAILVELQLEIEECVDGGEGSPQFEQGVDIARAQVVEMIQQKIDLLRSKN